MARPPLTAEHKVIELGDLDKMDRDGSVTNNAQYAPSILGGKTFGSKDDPLYDDTMTMKLVDYGRDGGVNANDWRTKDHIEYPSGSGSTQQKVDTIFIVNNVTITQRLPDGSFREFQGTVRIVQDESGKTFMVPPMTNGGTNHEMETIRYPVVSVKFPTSPRDYDRRGNSYALDRAEFEGFVCFARGTLITTAEGQVAVEDLTEGQLVLTRDNGLQPIRWIGSRKVNTEELLANENWLPIRIRANALANGVPSSDLMVSPQHRVLVRSGIAQKMFGVAEVLVAAKHLCAIDGIEVASDITNVEYFHILFDRHEVITSNGAATESLYTGQEALKSLGAAAYKEVFALFPQLEEAGFTPIAARPLGAGRKGRKLASRHAQNSMPLQG